MSCKIAFITVLTLCGSVLAAADTIPISFYGDAGNTWVTASNAGIAPPFLPLHLVYTYDTYTSTTNGSFFDVTAAYSSGFISFVYGGVTYEGTITGGSFASESNFDPRGVPDPSSTIATFSGTFELTGDYSGTGTVKITQLSSLGGAFPGRGYLDLNATASPVPEPGTMALLISGAVLGIAKRLRKGSCK